MRANTASEESGVVESIPDISSTSLAIRFLVTVLQIADHCTTQELDEDENDDAVEGNGSPIAGDEGRVVLLPRNHFE